MSSGLLGRSSHGEERTEGALRGLRIYHNLLDVPFPEAFTNADSKARATPSSLDALNVSGQAVPFFDHHSIKGDVVKKVGRCFFNLCIAGSPYTDQLKS